jgi:hypothetical protein
MRPVKEQAKIPLYYILFCTTVSFLLFSLLFLFFLGGQIDIHSIIADGPSLPGYLSSGYTVSAF